MELRAYLEIFWRRKWVIIITAFVTVAVVVLGTLMMTPKYVASTTLRILTTEDGNVNFGELEYVERLLNTYAAIVRSGPVLTELQQRLQINNSPELDIEFPANSELMKIRAEDPDPILAAKAANIVADILIAETRKTKAGRDFSISVINPAEPPRNPASPRWIINIVLGVFVGVAGGVGLAFLLENLDTRLYTKDQIEAATKLATIGQIPTDKKRQPCTWLNGGSLRDEAFRSLRTNIVIPEREAPLQTLLFTSAEPGEGKSTIVSNLALAIASSGRKVIIVDGDLRLPTLHKIFDLPNYKGLSTILKQETDLVETMQDCEFPGVQVLTSGPLPANPAELLHSTQMSALIAQLEHQFDHVLLDTPALLAVSDGAILAPLVDGVVLVVGRAQARRETIAEARHQLATVNARITGVVVNRAKKPGRYDHYYQKSAKQSTIINEAG